MSAGAAPPTAEPTAGAEHWTSTLGPTLLGLLAGVLGLLVLDLPPLGVLALAAALGAAAWWWFQSVRGQGPRAPDPPLTALAALALTLNLAALAAGRASVASTVAVAGWLTAAGGALAAVARRPAGALRAALYQVAAASVGAAIGVGGLALLGPLAGVDPSRPDLAAELEGHWRGHWGEHYVRVDGNQVKIVYDWGNGRILGRIEDGRVRGWWTEKPSRQPDGDAGEVEFQLVRRGATLLLDGKWRFGTEGSFSDTWDLTRVDGRIPPEVEARFADEASFVRHP